MLNLVTTDFDEGMMSILFQLFDPKHHCFTFPDYQLVPMLEELSKLLGVPILEKIPFTGLEEDPKSEDVSITLHLKISDIESKWERRSGVKGLLTKFLIWKAQVFLDAMSFHAFEDILALLIYGLVLFPNPDQLIDVHQYFPYSQFSAYIARGYSAFTPHPYYEETRNSYVLYTFAL